MAVARRTGLAWVCRSLRGAASCFPDRDIVRPPSRVLTDGPTRSPMVWRGDVRPGVFLGLGHELVADPRLAQQIARVIGIRLDLLSNLGDQRPELLWTVRRTLAPHRDQDLPMRQHPVGMTGEIDEQLELLGREPDLVDTNQHPASVEVDDQPASIEAAGA